MKKFLFSIIIIGVMSFLAEAQKMVYPLPLDSTTVVKSASCRYMLSATAFKVDVTVSKTREIKGHYADYAEKLLGLSNIINENKTYYKIKAVNIEPVQVPDMSQPYLVVLSSKQLKDGFLYKASQQTACTPVFGQLEARYTTEATPIPSFFRNYADPTFAATEAAFVETKIIDGVVTQVPANTTKMVSKSNNQKAQEAADLISKCRQSQYNLVSGEQETAYSAEAIDRMVGELKTWENNYLSLFSGITLEDEITYTFYVTPMGESTPAFAFDATNGISLANINESNGYFFKMSNMLCPRLLSAEQTKAKANNGYRYRTAVPMNVTLTHQGKNIYDFGSFNMNQYGRIQILPKGTDNLDINTIGFIY